MTDSPFDGLYLGVSTEHMGAPSGGGPQLTAEILESCTAKLNQYPSKRRRDAEFRWADALNKHWNQLYRHHNKHAGEQQ